MTVPMQHRHGGEREPRRSASSWLVAPAKDVAAHGHLIWELTRREIAGRYKGASFGLMWSLISPFLMLVVYNFAFGTVMDGRWQQAAGADASFAVILFSGLIVHGFFAECLNRAPLLVVSQPNFVKRVIFPLEILPWPMVLSALFHVFMNLLVFVALRLVMDGAFSHTIFLFPIVLLPLMIGMLGVSWFVASLGVYVRDITQVTPVLATAMLFLSSALMPVQAVPAEYRWIFASNPLTPVIEQARDVMLWSRMPDWLLFGKSLAVSLLVLYVGRSFFQATRRGFADVL